MACCPICGVRLTEDTLSQEKPKEFQKKVIPNTETKISQNLSTNSLPRMAIAILILNYRICEQS